MIHLVSDTVYVWFITGLITSTAIGWSLVEIVRLRRTMKLDTRDPVVRDRIFGHLVGLAIAMLAAVGVIRYHLHFL